MISGIVTGAVLGLIGLGWSGVRFSSSDRVPATAAAAAPAAVDTFPEKVAPFVQKYCSDCHSGDGAEAGLDVTVYRSTQDVLGARKHWEKIFDMLEFEAMPPGDADPLPSAEERREVIAWLEDKLFRLDCQIVKDPGRVTVRRLNRAEYNNTVRDLLGVDFRPADDFPSDDVGYGFDNIGDVLSLSPLLLEKYLAAAETISERVIVDYTPATQSFAQNRLRSTTGGSFSPRARVWTLASNGDVFAEVDVPRDGRYRIRVEAGADQAGSEPAKVRVLVDRKALKTFDTQGDRKPNWFAVETALTRGRHRIAAEFINDYYNPSARDPRQRDRNLYVRTIEVSGPLSPDPDELPESHRRIVTCRPGDGRSVRDCAEEILRPLAAKAFRRPVTDDEVERLVGLVELAVQEGESFEGGLRLGLQAILVSPHFLFRVETGSAPDESLQAHPINDFELASRLSYFLWSSMPDDTLRQLAESGKLHEPDVLRGQVKRMLADPRARALADNFAAQWLNLGMLDEITPDPKAFPEFNDQLRNDMRTESLLFFDAIVRNDGSILDLLDGRYTFVNERLAKLYGLPNVKGEEFRRVSLEGTQRAGVLTHASVLTLTSNPTRTSPVKRGKWILENILATPPPAPPPNVPELEATAKSNPDAPLREQLKLHRADPACASCHRRMDDLGFGFENFDAIGRWRDRDGKHPVDAAGELPGGVRFSGPIELIGILKGRRDRFARCLAEKLLTYALGRGLEFYDRCTVDRIVVKLAEDNYRFSTLVTEIVLSDAFRMRRGEKAENKEPAHEDN